MKKIIYLIFIILILSLVSVNACIDNSDCSGDEVCEGEECKTPSIIDSIADLPPALLALFWGGEPDEDDGDDDGDNGGRITRYYDGYYGLPCIESWKCSGWSACIMGKKTRTCEDAMDCGTTYYQPAESFNCDPTALASCNDGILNQGEEDVDCGGPCAQCNTCFDNEENCHGGDCELGLDCGGPCMPCKHALSIILIIITAIIVIVLLILGIIYWRMKKTGEIVEDTVEEFRPPTQPSSMLKI